MIRSTQPLNIGYIALSSHIEIIDISLPILLLILFDFKKPLERLIPLVCREFLQRHHGYLLLTFELPLHNLLKPEQSHISVLALKHIIDVDYGRIHFPQDEGFLRGHPRFYLGQHVILPLANLVRDQKKSLLVR